MTSPEGIFDCTQVPFPSDALTIGKLRRLHAKDFDVASAESEYVDFFSPGDDHPAGYVALGAMLHAERKLAEISFIDTRVAMSGGELLDSLSVRLKEESDEERKAYTDTLVKAYQEFGLAPGPKAAQEVIREFCDQAAAQARRHGEAIAS